MVSRDFVSFFACNIKKLIVWCVSAKKNYYNLMKNNHKFQASVTERCTSLSKISGIFLAKFFKSTSKKVKYLKKLYCTSISSQDRGF